MMIDETSRLTFAGLPAPLRVRWTEQSLALLESFHACTGAELIARSGPAHEDAERLFHAPFVVVSHGAEADPILNYGNAAALALWEMSPEKLLATPSRLTAEPERREARERILAQTSRRGFVKGYEGVRVSATGRRFRIWDVAIWTVTGADACVAGQAATFAQWTML